MIVVVVAVLREPDEHHEVPKWQRGKTLNLVLLLSCALKTSQGNDICKNFTVTGNGCVQQDIAALPRIDGLKRLADHVFWFYDFYLIGSEVHVFL